MSNFRNQVAEELIRHIEAGTAPWQKPWNPNLVRTGPFNPTTDKHYRGINAWWLDLQGRQDPRWLTYRQAAAAGAQVRKGEKGTLVEYWKWTDTVPKVDEDGKPVLDAGGRQQTQEVRLDRPKVFHAVVFNAEQIDGLAPFKAPEPTFDPVLRADEVITRGGVLILNDQRDRAFYSPMEDRIHLPLPAAFNGAYEYYATALHELGHATGHPDRLGREFGPFGSEVYAKEELRAEMASFMVATELGLGHYPERHASYVGSWLQALKDDRNLLFQAARDAEIIRTWIMEPEKRLSLEMTRGQEKAPMQEQTAQPVVTPEADRRLYLAVPFEEKDQAKAAGAKWDKDRKAWFVPEGVDGSKFNRWQIIPHTLRADLEAMRSATTDQARIEVKAEAIMTIADLPDDRRKAALEFAEGYGIGTTDVEKYLAFAAGQAAADRETDKAIAAMEGPDPWPERAPAKDRQARDEKERQPAKPDLLDRLENYFRPGRIVPAYGGRDHVVEFRRLAENSAGWEVAVQAVTSDGELEPIRTHSTRPSDRNLEAWEKDNPVPVREKREKLFLNVPFDDKERAKSAGAKWDRRAKAWFVPEGTDPAPFRQWMEKAPAPEISPVEEFAAACRENGLVIEGPPTMDGKWHRVSVEGDKKGQMSGAYRGFLDGRPAGQVMNYRNGDKAVQWVATGNKVDPAEYERLKAEAGARQAQQQEQLRAQYRAVAKRAYGIFVNAAPASDDHVYLQRKGVQATDLRVDGEGNLLVPMRDETGFLWSMQTIKPDGTKLFMKDGRKTGLMHVIKGTAKGPTIVGEGYATAKDIHDATGHTVVVAFDAGNLEPVARALRKQSPDLDLVIAADDDHKLEAQGKANTGIERAKAAAEAVEARFIAPPLLPGEKLKGLTDYNDLKQERGAKALAAVLKEQLGQAVEKRATRDKATERHPAAQMAM